MISLNNTLTIQANSIVGVKLSKSKLKAKEKVTKYIKEKIINKIQEYKNTLRGMGQNISLYTIKIEQNKHK